VANLLWYLHRIGWIDVLDILLVAFVFFWLLYLLRGTRAVPLLRGVVLLVIAVALLSGYTGLRAFGWLTKNALPALIVAIPVVFQQELRHALERLGRAGTLLGRTAGQRAVIERTVAAVTEACGLLAERRHGALVVIERETGLQEIADDAIPIDATITPELLLTIFEPHTTLHDGAVIVRNGRILAAGCVLPLSTAFLADRELGLRHRAAIGVTEESDAVVVVVSEERGSIAIAHSGRVIRNLDAKRLGTVMHAFYQPALERAWPRWIARARQAVRGLLKEGEQ
jgi:diadenylate cyclase